MIKPEKSQKICRRIGVPVPLTGGVLMTGRFGLTLPLAMPDYMCVILPF